VLVALTKIDLAPSAVEVLAIIERIRAAYPQVRACVCEVLRALSSGLSQQRQNV
jgi:hypothetical protein